MTSPSSTFGEQVNEQHGGPEHTTPGWRSTRAWIILAVLLLGGLAVDLASKSLAFQRVAGEPVILDRETLLANPGMNPIPQHDGIAVLPWRLLDLKLTINYGAVFGLGKGMRAFFIGFTILAMVVCLVVFIRFTTAADTLAHVGLSLILVGGLGNLYDRIIFGVVRDFLYLLPGWRLPFGLAWPGGVREVFPWVFNVADMLLLIGMALLLIHFYLLDRKQLAERKSEDRTQKSSGDL